ncbi:phenylalanine 4-monooxygenase [Neisseria montereyensis]|uniref:phenylalanine 4-monooxygenase n=1 Tax=Neisseria montereyensis TaxID=2973938 RepID=A0ABT2FDT8_9NEIS|nr:phenylalanine 4-monooxygenase [Neisseria montereyensis]MCS4534295.1 phenylalanine 4-monooxygenase [Neisseria montereyensis]
MTTACAYTAREADSDGFIHYPPEEHQVWHDLIVRQQRNLPGRACHEYLEGLAKLALPHDHIPQLADIDAVLLDNTGWRTAPVPALIPFGRFFKLLANKAFPVATFIRRHEDFDYIQEPDIFHEIAGHCPLLTHPAFAEFNEIYGKLGLDADKTERVFLARLYWFTIEFGLVGLNPQERRIYGGGILSSPSETEYALSGKPEYRAFNIADVLRTPYRIDRIQPIYYVLDKLDTLFEIAQSDIMGEVHKAMSKGLFEPHPSLAD